MKTKTTYKNYNYAYAELSEKAKMLLSKCINETMLSPLSYCRMLQESAKGEKYIALCEVERYLINE